MTSRRALNSTDESAASLDSNIVQDAYAGFRFLSASELQDVSAEEVLRRSLSTRSVVSTTSSFAERFQHAASRPHLQVIREIGAGLQGTIFEQVGKALVLKKEKPENSQQDCNLRKEFSIHQVVSAAFQTYRNHPTIYCDVTVPEAREFIASNDNTAWPTLLPMLPADCQVASDIVEMERVLPLPKVIRHALIQMFYPFPTDMEHHEKQELVQRKLNTTSNKHCLVRPYLGVARKHYNTSSFSLRNLILGFDDLRRCGTDCGALTQALGSAYAILHWAAHIDGDDIEFVLGSSATTAAQESAPWFQHRKIGLYLIDFGQCERVDVNNKSPQEVYQAFRGAMVTGDNACFIPNYRKTPELFRVFKQCYADTAKRILAEDAVMESKFDIDEFMELYQEYVEDFL